MPHHIASPLEFPSPRGVTHNLQLAHSFHIDNLITITITSDGHVYEKRIMTIPPFLNPRVGDVDMDRGGPGIQPLGGHCIEIFFGRATYKL